MGQSWIFTPCPSSTRSSFPTKGVGEWLGCVFTQRLCTYVVHSATTQGPPWLPGSHCDCVTALVWDHWYKDMETASFRCRPLVLVHGFIYRNEWERYSNTNTMTLHYQFNCICGLHKIQSFGIVKAVCLYFFPFFFLAWTRPKILTVIIRFWLAVNWFLSMSTPSFCMSSDWAQPSAQAAQIEASTS